MATFNKLLNRAATGEDVLVDLQAALVYSRSRVHAMTMPTLGVFSAELTNRQAQAQAEVETAAADAVKFIPLLENAILKLGGSIHPKPYWTDNVRDGNGRGE